ncbi:CDP-alcohol phosphatidyltransferase family protein [Chitinibacter sp. SCUT-21]|uniref:CDP-alcohol phosphatidyltransferase family protein n=1 Tax=Chitinibacter sp. SCUT-21 TaxID=2970891 RepID=UPI0035A630F8
MSIYQLKASFQNLLRPIVRRLASWGITANAVTVTAMLISVSLGILLFAYAALWRPEDGGYRLWLLLPVWLFVRMALNAIDGMLAREHGQKSNLGAILNETGDVISDVALIIPFFILAWHVDDAIAVPLIFAVLILAIITEYIGVLGPMLGASRRYDGPLGKSDRAFVFGALGLAYGLGWIPTGTFVLSGVFGLCTVLLLVTCVKRVKSILNEVKHA